MNITPDEAQAALDAIRQATTKARGTTSFWAYTMLLWGIVWTAGFLAIQLAPQVVNWIWAAMLIMGMVGSAIIGMTQGGHVRSAPGSQMAFISSRLGIFYGTLYGFAALCLIIFQLTALQVGMFWIMVVMFSSIIAGAWLQKPVSIAAGIAITLISLLGYYLLPHFFWLWVAAFAGLPLVGMSIYFLRKK